MFYKKLRSGNVFFFYFIEIPVSAEEEITLDEIIIVHDNLYLYQRYTKQVFEIIIPQFDKLVILFPPSEPLLVLAHNHSESHGYHKDAPVAQLGSNLQGALGDAPLFLGGHVNPLIFCILQPQMGTYICQISEWGASGGAQTLAGGQ